ncbi:MAG: lysylphosphatidylglycerol synthase transmembrane domain-containing protein [Acidobacteriota bacterium]
MSSDSRARSFPWQTVIIGVLTVGLVAIFLLTVNLKEAWHAVLHAHPAWIAAALAVTLQTYVLRAWRWQALLVPIGHAGYRNAFRTTVIGFATTFLLPGRIGEVLRPYLLARAEGFNPAAVFATVVIERVVDLVCVILLFAYFVLTTSVEVSEQVKVAGAIAGVSATAALILMTVLAGHPERLGRWSGRLARVLPGRAADVVSDLVKTFTEGLAVMRRPGPMLKSFGLSILLWLSIALGIWFTSRAFDLTFAFSGSFLVMMYLVVGVAVPTPAGVGSFHWMYRLAVTQFFGASADVAAAAAITLHAVSFLPISLLGLLFMTQDGMTLSKLKQMKSTAEAEEHPAADRGGVQ